MYKNASYKEKYAALDEWLPSIIEVVKRDLKNEHLRKDLAFIKKYFSSKNPQKISTDEMVEAYRRALADESNANELGEFITARWLLKHSELYEHFERELSQISPDFTALDEIETEAAKEIVSGSVQSFGALPTYLFAVLNSVVFPSDIFHQLQHHAREEHGKQKEEATISQERQSLDNMQRSFEAEIARTTDKYEKKIAGLQKKYITDTENLKKQIAALQRKLNEKQ